jgi:hypothetical protein
VAAAHAVPVEPVEVAAYRIPTGSRSRLPPQIVQAAGREVLHLAEVLQRAVPPQGGPP